MIETNDLVNTGDHTVERKRSMKTTFRFNNFMLGGLQKSLENSYETEISDCNKAQLLRKQILFYKRVRNLKHERWKSSMTTKKRLTICRMLLGTAFSVRQQ